MEVQQPNLQPVIEIRPAVIFAFIKISGLLLAAAGFLLFSLALFSGADLAKPGDHVIRRLPLPVYSQDQVSHNARILASEQGVVFQAGGYGGIVPRQRLYFGATFYPSNFQIDGPAP